MIWSELTFQQVDQKPQIGEYCMRATTTPAGLFQNDVQNEDRNVVICLAVKVRWKLFTLQARVNTHSVNC